MCVSRSWSSRQSMGYGISSNAISDSRNLKNERNPINNFFLNAPNFPLWEGKLNETKMAEEYCWAITQVAGLLCCGRSGPSDMKFGLQLDLCIYICSLPTCAKCDLPSSSRNALNCTSRGVPVHSFRQD